VLVERVRVLVRVRVGQRVLVFLSPLVRAWPLVLPQVVVGRALLQVLQVGLRVVQLRGRLVLVLPPCPLVV
jgi:hypothetical protein